MGIAVLWAVGKVQALLHSIGNAPAAAAAAPSDLCAPGQPILPYLRPINAAFNLGTFVLIYRLLYRTRKVRQDVERTTCGCRRLIDGKGHDLPVYSDTKRTAPTLQRFHSN